MLSQTRPGVAPKPVPKILMPFFGPPLASLSEVIWNGGGVGCGVLIETERDGAGERIVGVQGDDAHPANFGRLCSKGRALADSARQAAREALAAYDGVEAAG